MNPRDITRSERASSVARALGMLDSPAALAVVQSLCSKPQTVVAIAHLTGLAPDGVTRLMTELEKGGVVRWWTAQCWQLTQLGAELWTVLEPAVANRQTAGGRAHAGPYL